MLPTRLPRLEAVNQYRPYFRRVRIDLPVNRLSIYWRMKRIWWCCVKKTGVSSPTAWGLYRRASERALKHPLIFYFGLLGECFDMRDSRAFTAFVPEKLLVFQSSKNIKSYNQVTCGMLTY